MFHLLTGWYSTPTVMDTARVTSGPAPLLVVLDVFEDAAIPTPPVDGSGEPNPGSWWYGWHYGDDDAVVWSETGKSKNWSTGPIGAHVYETPGSYTITLKIMDENGLFSTYEQDITVTNPDTVYESPSGSTFYVAPATASPAGSDSNDGSIGSPWLTATHALSTSGLFAASGPRRVLFKRDGTYAKTSTPTISSKTGPYHIGTYGTGADPIIAPSAGQSGLVLANTATHVRVVDININGTAGAGNTAGLTPGNDCLFLRCTVDELEGGILSDDGDGLKTGSGVVECTIGPTLGNNGIYWSLAYNIALLGNHAGLDSAAGNEHVFRVYPSHSAVSHNYWHGGTTGKTHLRIAGYYPSTGLTNGEFQSSTGWNVGAQWGISGGQATKTGAGTSVLSQTLSNGRDDMGRPFTWSCTRTSLTGSIRLRYGGTNGADRTTLTQTSEVIVPTSGVLMEFAPDSDWEGTVDFTQTSSRHYLDTFRDGEEPTEVLEHVVVSDNISDDYVNGGVYNIMIGVTNTGDAMQQRHLIFERNTIESGPTTTNALNVDGAAYATIRNNKFDLTNSGSGSSRAINVAKTGAASQPPEGNVVIGNSIYKNGAYSVTGAIRLSTGADGCTVQNNVLVRTSETGTVTSDVSGGSNTLTTNSTTTTGMVNPPSDMSPSGGSSLIDVGTASAYCRDDFGGDGWFTTRNDLGAFEVGTPNDPWEYLVVVVDDPPAESPDPGHLLGVNPDRMSFQSVPIFKDFFKQCGHTGSGPLVPWLARDSSGFGSNATSVAAMTDATGYPDVDLPHDAGGGEGPAVLETRMVALEDAAYPAGTYYVYWDGTATIGIAGDATPVTLTASGQTFEVVTPTTTGLVLRILTTSGTRVTNIRVVHEDFIATYEDEPFYPDLIERLLTFRRREGGTYLPLLLRTFELSRTNGKRDSANDPDIVLWTARTTTSWASQATSNGMAWEHIFELLNTLEATGWICVHHQADSAYRLALAQLAKDTLNEALELFIQWSNEASFNGAFDQCLFTRVQGNILYGGGETAATGNKYLAYISATMFGEFFGVWGLDSDRLYTVMDTQASSTTVTNRLFTNFADVTYNPQGYRLDYMAFAPYFGLETSTTDRFGEDFIDGAAHGLTYPTAPFSDANDVIQDFYLPLSLTNMTNQVAEIASWSDDVGVPHSGVLPCAYESGSSLTSDDAADQANATLTAYLEDLLAHPSTYAVHRHYLDQWDLITDRAPLCWFTFAGPPYSGANMYGAMRSLSQPLSEAPKWQAFWDFATGQTAASPSNLRARSLRYPQIRWSIRRLH